MKGLGTGCLERGGEGVQKWNVFCLFYPTSYGGILSRSAWVSSAGMDKTVLGVTWASQQVRASVPLPPGWSQPGMTALYPSMPGCDLHVSTLLLSQAVPWWCPSHSFLSFPQSSLIN